MSTGALLALLNSNPHLKAVSSHQIRYPVPQVRGLMFFDLCFLRDPIDRILSHLRLFPRQAGRRRSCERIRQHSDAGRIHRVPD